MVVPPELDEPPPPHETNPIASRHSALNFKWVECILISRLIVTMGIVALAISLSYSGSATFNLYHTSVLLDNLHKITYSPKSVFRMLRSPR